LPLPHLFSVAHCLLRDLRWNSLRDMQAELTDGARRGGYELAELSLENPQNHGKSPSYDHRKEVCKPKHKSPFQRWKVFPNLPMPA
jgi:hypothetical protein